MGHNGSYGKLHKTILAFVWCIKPGILLAIAMLMSYYTPYEQILKERLRMRPGLPAYEMWKSSPDIGRLSIYFFNITNADEYLSGEDSKLEMDEIGPITFKEIWSYKDIKFNDNGTLTYSLKKTGIYEESNNNINLNDTIVVFNFPLLLSTSYLSNGMDITKFAFNNLVRILNLQPIVKMTIYDYLYNNRGAFLSGISTFLPSLVPFDNVGMAKLMAASYLSDSSFFVKIGFNSMVRILDTRPIVTMTIYDYLFNNSDDFLKAAGSFLPSLVPYDNVGIIKLLYWNTEDNITMFIGKDHGDSQFSMIDKFNGSPYFPGYDGNCKVNLTKATEFMMLSQNLETTDVFFYTRKAVCRLIEVGFKETTRRYGLPAYKYQVKPSYLNRTLPEEADCYKGNPTLPNGLSDLANCWGDLPLVASVPYFEYGDDILRTYVNFNVNTTRPLPYIIAEPFTGLPYERMASVQLNVLVRSLRGFDDRFSRFADTVLPIAWTECSSYELPTKMIILLYVFYAVYYLQFALICLFLYFGFTLIWPDVIVIKARSIFKKITKGKSEKNRLDIDEIAITKDEVERNTLLGISN